MLRLILPVTFEEIGYKHSILSITFANISKYSKILKCTVDITCNIWRHLKTLNIFANISKYFKILKYTFNIVCNIYTKHSIFSDQQTCFVEWRSSPSGSIEPPLTQSGFHNNFSSVLLKICQEKKRIFFTALSTKAYVCNLSLIFSNISNLGGVGESATAVSDDIHLLMVALFRFVTVVKLPTSATKGIQVVGRIATDFTNYSNSHVFIFCRNCSAFKALSSQLVSTKDTVIKLPQNSLTRHRQFEKFIKCQMSV